MFLCLLWPFRENVPLPNFAKGFLGIRECEPDHRPSQLLMQEAFVLFILFILFIDVHKKRGLD